VTEPNPDVPYLLIIAGPNGAGKSSHWDREFRARNLKLSYVNADEIARAMDPHPSDKRDRAAMEAAGRQRREHIERRESFAFETVFSHPSKLEEIRLARDAGYYIRLVFIGLASPQLSIARVTRRVALGGHPVPADRIPGRYERNLANLRKAIPLADEVSVWDNSAEDQKPVEILAFRNGELVEQAPETPKWALQALAGLLGAAQAGIRRAAK
jgi:predicted ABC-type ATPase